MPLSASIGVRLMHQHETIRELIGNLPVADLQRCIHPGKWSAFENIAHLAAYQHVFIIRLDRIGQGSSPAFDRYVAENDPLFPGFLNMSLTALLDDIDDRRALIFSMLEDGGEALLAKTGLHPRYGLLTGMEWTEFFLLHEAHHLFTIFLLVRDLRKPPQ
jgi:hypothetical protein